MRVEFNLYFFLFKLIVWEANRCARKSCQWQVFSTSAWMKHRKFFHNRKKRIIQVVFTSLMLFKKHMCFLEPHSANVVYKRQINFLILLSLRHYVAPPSTDGGSKSCEIATSLHSSQWLNPLDLLSLPQAVNTASSLEWKEPYLKDLFSL